MTEVSALRKLITAVAAARQRRATRLELPATFTTLRRYLGITQKDLAEKLNVSPAHLSFIERRRNKFHDEVPERLLAVYREQRPALVALAEHPAHLRLEYQEFGDERQLIYHDLRSGETITFELRPEGAYIQTSTYGPDGEDVAQDPINLSEELHKLLERAQPQ